ncbi:MAG: metabolite traffic protein EboE [Saprospiraceae bacterium]|nr:metabolite traffic protein EboE [Saprospiraceae bacterium]
MQIDFHNAHLTYCSNIHPGESWVETFENLKKYTTQIRDKMDRGPFGIGLRLSNEASISLSEEGALSSFQDWLQKENMYVFTINGFPFGGFHKQVVKDQVHFPDWTTSDRLNYTKRLFDILSVLLPADLDGGVSTSPISYRFWHQDSQAIEEVKNTACSQMIDLVVHLNAIRIKTGKILHLDIEPEPDGILETSQEFVDFYNNYLLNEGKAALRKELNCSDVDAEQMIRMHIQLCYDICHFAVGFEKSTDAISRILDAGIKIGRIQISAALSSGVIHSEKEKSLAIEGLREFNEPVYLHQAVIREANGQLTRYPDLKPALDNWMEADQSELRTHYHVPLFTERYGKLIPTQQDIKDVLQIWKEKDFTNHLEVETYTWDVLPEDKRTDIVSSVVRELEWVISTLEK